MIKLKEIRKAKGMTQAELAAAVRHADPTADQVTISVLERGELYPTEKLRDAICEALECTEADIYDGLEAFFVPAEEKKISYTTMLLEEIFAFSPKYIEREDLRQKLTDITGRDVSDRQMRDWVSQAKREGLVIGNQQDGNGYFLPTTEKELEAVYRQNENRAKAILAQQKHIKWRIRECRQMSQD